MYLRRGNKNDFAKMVECIFTEKEIKKVEFLLYESDEKSIVESVKYINNGQNDWIVYDDRNNKIVKKSVYELISVLAESWFYNNNGCFKIIIKAKEIYETGTTY